jgi:dienelactone hydrolase
MTHFFWKKVKHAVILIAVFFLTPASATTKDRTIGDALMEYRQIPVQFDSHGETLVGELFLPIGDGPFPAVSIIGPVGFVKEQAPLQYASRMVRQGIAALIFDPRYHGASSGEPRRHESGQAKIEDLTSSVDFLTTHPLIDAQKVGLLGICQGVNWAIEASIKDTRVKSLGIVAGHYLMPQVAQMYLGSAENVAQRVTRSLEAKTAYDNKGELTYIDIVGSNEALLKSDAINDWYMPWANTAPWFKHRGQWENRITAMSEASIWQWRIDETLRSLTTDVMMIHADHAASGAAIPKALFDSIPAKNKQLHWIEDANQFMFYEHPTTIDKVIYPLGNYFRETLL